MTLFNIVGHVFAVCIVILGISGVIYRLIKPRGWRPLFFGGSRKLPRTRFTADGDRSNDRNAENDVGRDASVDSDPTGTTPPEDATNQPTNGARQDE